MTDDYTPDPVDIDAQELDRICWKAINQATDFQLRLYLDDEGVHDMVDREYVVGAYNFCDEWVEDLHHIGVDVAARAESYAAEHDLNIVPAWFGDVDTDIEPDPRVDERGAGWQFTCLPEDEDT